MTDFIKNTPDVWRDYFPDAHKFKHKYDRGHGVFFGGAQMTGAICLSSYAATRMGLGIATIISPTQAQDVYRTYKPHIIVKSANSFDEKCAVINAAKPDVVVIGPGYGKGGETNKLVIEILKNKSLKVVLDADALMTFEDDPRELFKHLNENHIITPHEGEFSRLFSPSTEDKYKNTLEAAELCGCLVVHKGQETVIAGPTRKIMTYNANCPYLATAGTGDVLTGFIAGLLGLGMAPEYAAAAGVYLHGECGRKTGAGLIAPDVVEALPTILKAYF